MKTYRVRFSRFREWLKEWVKHFLTTENTGFFKDFLRVLRKAYPKGAVHSPGTARQGRCVVKVLGKPTQLSTHQIYSSTKAKRGVLYFFTIFVMFSEVV